MRDLLIALAVVVAGWLLLAARRRLAATDAKAAVEGWTITRLPWGGRVYRDPRLDQLGRQHLAQVLGPDRAGRGAR